MKEIIFLVRDRNILILSRKGYYGMIITYLKFGSKCYLFYLEFDYFDSFFINVFEDKDHISLNRKEIFLGFEFLIKHSSGYFETQL